MKILGLRKRFTTSLGCNQFPVTHISTEGSLRRPLAYDDHPIHPSHPIHPRKTRRQTVEKTERRKDEKTKRQKKHKKTNRAVANQLITPIEQAQTT